MRRVKRVGKLSVAVFTFIAAGIMISNAALAGLVFDGDYSPASDTWTGSTYVYIGTTGQSTYTAGTGSLAVSTGSDVSVGQVFLGYIDGTSGTLSIAGPSASWTNDSRFYAGYYGSGMVQVSSGGSLTVNYHCYIGGGGYSSTAASGTLSVDGAGSRVWTDGRLYAGYYGDGHFEVTDGGYLENDDGYIGSYGSGATVSGLVDGAGSRWINRDSLYIGSSSGSEAGAVTLTISNGGYVQNDEGVIGGHAGSANVVKVDGSSGGTPSTWKNTNYLKVGHDGGAGTLEITNGGLVEVDSYTAIYAGGSKIDFGSNGGTLSTNSLYSGVSSTSLAGTGTIVAKGLVSDVDLTFDSTGSNKTYTIGGVNLNVDMSASSGNGDLGVGYTDTTAAHSLTFNSGTVSGENGYIAYGVGSTATATISGNSLWSNSGSLYVGYDGLGSMTILGGTVTNASTGYVGYSSVADNTVIVDGTGSAWIGDGGLNIGDQGHGILKITNGGYVENAQGAIACSTAYFSSYGSVSVDGVGSTWYNRGNLYVGQLSDGDLSITNQSTVTVDGETYVGWSSGVRGTIDFGTNGGTLTTQSLYATGSDLFGTGTVDTRGIVTDANVTFNSGGSTTLTLGSVQVNVDMTDSSNVGGLGVGYWGAGGTLRIQNGSQIHSTTGCLGYQSYTSGTAWVDGSGSEWNVSSDFFVGNSGTGVLKIVNGGQVNCDYNASITVYNTGSGTATVDGAGSAWNVNGELCVGQQGHGAMVITNGASVSSITSKLNGSSSDANSVVTVGGGTGVSTWTTSDSLAIGNWGHARLTINSGGSVSVGGTTMVSSSTWNDNSSGTLTFAGGTLSTKSLYVTPSEISGSGTINTRGLVTDLALQFDSTHGLNQTVSGLGTVAVNLDLSDTTNVGDLGVGYRGTGSLTIQDIAVTSANGYLGYCASTATATVSNGGSWIVPGMITIATAPTWKGCEGTLNIDHGGTVVCNSISAGEGYMTVNFDGGVVKPYDSDNDDWVSQGWYDNTNVYIKEGGAVFDTEGRNMGIQVALKHGGSLSTDGGITKRGAGTLTLSGGNYYQGQTTLEEGTLVLGSSAQYMLLVGAGGSDIQSGKMVFEYSGTAPDIGTFLTTSYGVGGTAAWTTGQFRSTKADGNHGLGWSDNGTDEVTIMYTLYGDSNLDGSVNGTDLNAVLSYYNQSSQVWSNGDFNYDGSVNGTDLNTVLSNYNQSLSSSTAAVPEPSTVLLALAGLASLLVYVRSKRK